MGIPTFTEEEREQFRRDADAAMLQRDARRSPTGRSDALERMLRPDEHGVVQFAVRLPVGLRERVREQAEREGCTMQDVVIDALVDRLDRSTSPERAMADALSAAIQRRLGDFVADGRYAELVAAEVDPELTTS